MGSGETVNIVTGDLSEDVRGVIEKYLEGHRSRSLATLSRSSGVSYTTLRRLYQREGHPTAEPVLKIVDATLTNDQKLEFLNRYYPEIAGAISKVQREAYSPSASRQEPLKPFYMRDPHNFILNLAQNNKGTTPADVRRLCGERGIEALQELIDHEILERDFVNREEVYRLPPLASHDADMALVQMKLSADHFDRSLIGTKAARLFHTTASVNVPTVERIHDILSSAIREIFALKDDPRNSGDVPLFVDLMMNVYDKTTLHPERSES